MSTPTLDKPSEAPNNLRAMRKSFGKTSNTDENELTFTKPPLRPHEMGGPQPRVLKAAEVSKLGEALKAAQAAETSEAPKPPRLVNPNNPWSVREDLAPETNPLQTERNNQFDVTLPEPEAQVTEAAAVVEVVPEPSDGQRKAANYITKMNTEWAPGLLNQPEITAHAQAPKDPSQ